MEEKFYIVLTECTASYFSENRKGQDMTVTKSELDMLIKIAKANNLELLIIK